MINRRVSPRTLKPQAARLRRCSQTRRQGHRWGCTRHGARREGPGPLWDMLWCASSVPRSSRAAGRQNAGTRRAALSRPHLSCRRSPLRPSPDGANGGDVASLPRRRGSRHPDPSPTCAGSLFDPATARASDAPLARMVCPLIVCTRSMYPVTRPERQNESGCSYRPLQPAGRVEHGREGLLGHVWTDDRCAPRSVLSITRPECGKKHDREDEWTDPRLISLRLMSVL